MQFIKKDSAIKNSKTGNKNKT